MMSLVLASLTLGLSFWQSTPISRPDFSGSWTLDRSRSDSIDSVTLDIKQDAAQLSIETRRAGKASTRTYPFEAAPHSSAETVSAGHAHSYWDGTKLVNETADTISGQTVSYKQTRTMNAAGTEMTVETLTIVQHGYTLKDGKNYSTAKDVYVRSK